MNDTLARGRGDEQITPQVPNSPPWRALRWGAALVLTSVALWLALSRVQWAPVADAMAGAELRMLLLAFVTVVSTTLLKAARWQLLLPGSDERATPLHTLRILLVGQMGNSLLPARLGDAARVILMGRRAEGGAPAVLGTLVAEKALDGLIGLLVVTGLALWSPLPVWLRSPLLVLALLTAGALFVLALPSLAPRTTSPLARLALRRLPDRLYRGLQRAWARFSLGTGVLRSRRSAVWGLALTALIWCAAALTNCVTLASLQLRVPFWGYWLVLVTGYVASFLPAVPAQVGIFEYACVLAATASGLAPEPALAFGILLHVLVYAPPALLGPIAAASEGLEWRRLWNAR